MMPEEMIETGKRLLAWLSEHKLTVGLGAVLVLSLSIATTSYFSKKTREYESVWTRIGEMTLEASVAEFQEPKAREETLSKAVEQYKSMLGEAAAKKAAPWILFQLGNAQYSSGKYDDAISTYKEFLGKYGNHSLAPYVRQSLGYACEDKGHYDAALGYFQGATPQDNPYFVAQEKWDTGRCYEKMGRLEEARKAYTAAINLDPDSQWARLAQYRLDNLK